MYSYQTVRIKKTFVYEYVEIFRILPILGVKKSTDMIHSVVSVTKKSWISIFNEKNYNQCNDH